jgi:hypothetical protein
MTDAPEDPRHFFAEKLPADFNRALADQERAVENARRVLDSMRSVNATLRVIARGEGGGTFHLNVADGRMTAADAPAHAPFLTLIVDRGAFARLAAAAGDSALAFLGALAGLAGEMRLTRQRIENLTGVKGLLRFEVTGEDGFAFHTHFGPDPIPEEPTTTIRVDSATYAELREGRLDPQQAFLTQRIDVSGDLQLAMQLALAALSPD